MRIGTPREIKNHEYRIGLTPESVTELVSAGHEVLVESQGGLGIGADDEAYVQAGARIVDVRDPRAAGPDSAATAAPADEYLPDGEPLFGDAEPDFDGIDF